MEIKQFGDSILRGAKGVWKQLIKRPWMIPFDEYCQKTGAKIVSSDLLPARRAEVQHGPFVITLACHEGEEGFQAEAMARLEMTRPLSFSIASSRLLVTRAKALFAQRFLTGYQPFDEEVAIFGADLELLGGIFADDELRQLLVKYQDVKILLATEPKHANFVLTLGAASTQHQLKASFANKLPDVHRFHHLIEVIRLLLDQLCVVEIVSLKGISAP